MKNICKRLFMLCAFLGVFTILPETAEAAKLSMKNTDSQITLKYDDRYAFKKEIKESFHSSSQGGNKAAWYQSRILLRAVAFPGTTVPGDGLLSAYIKGAAGIFCRKKPAET